MKITQILNFGLGFGAIFAMAVQKYTNAYLLFSALLAWVILSNFVSGDNTQKMDMMQLAFMGFSGILFFTVVYLAMLTVKHKSIFEKNAPGDLEFYLKSTNTLIVFVFILVSGSSNLVKQLESIFPNCGNLILLLTLFLFTYLLGIMVVNISIIANKKITDG